MTTKNRSLSRQSGYPDLSRLADANMATFDASARASDPITSMRMLTVPKGKVGIITRLVGNAAGVIAGVPNNAPFYLRAPTMATPATSTTQFYQSWAAGGGSPSTHFPHFPFFNFDRNEQIFGTPSLSLPPDVQLDWAPRHPIVIPSQSEFGISQGSYIGNKVMAYGYIVDESDARSMGFEVTDRGSPLVSFNRLIQTGRVATDGAQDLVAARTGQCIQILDIYVRLQPLTAGASALTLADTDGNVVFKFRSDSQANMIEQKFSPGIYLPSGKKLTLTGDARSAGRGTVCIIGRYVDAADVPPNHFWSYLEPAFPSPGGATVAIIGKRVSSTFTLKYVGPSTTATTPGVGRRHVVEGFSFSATKDSTSTSDHVLFAVTTGTTGGNIGFGLGSLTQVNNPIGPIMTLSLPFQSVNLSVDQINVPCVANTGLILFDSVATAGTLLGTPAGEGDITGWGCTVWGRTVPTERATTDNPQFDGGITAT
jgi:hypothetical protein